MRGDRAADPITVLLADDHTLFREGLARLLASYGGMEVVGSVADGEEAAALARETRPDVVVTQVQLPLERAKGSLREMLSFPRPPKVVIVTMFGEPRYARELTGAGASAYLLKSASTAHLVGAIRRAVSDPDGENAVVVGMPREMLEEAGGASQDVLSARELEVLLLAARGLPNREIARALHLSEGTVKRHLATVYGKMGVGSRGEATRKALSEEWFTVRDVTEDGEPG